MNDSFIFYRSFYEAIKKVKSPEDREAILMAIAGYALDAEEPQLQYPLDMIFELIKPQIDANSKRKENGKKGGRKGSKFDEGILKQDYDVAEIEEALTS